jgi:hypothetical protein
LITSTVSVNLHALIKGYMGEANLVSGVKQTGEESVKGAIFYTDAVKHL